ncbi:hypothetical protein VTN02DRAFT_696 [Thermoascus thermophilus]
MGSSAGFSGASTADQGPGDAAVSRIATCDGSRWLSGTCSARTAPGLHASSSRAMWPTGSGRSQWKTALEKSRSSSGPGVQVLKSPCTNSTCGRLARAVASMSGELSRPEIVSAAGYRSIRACVEFPGPQPRSTIRRGSASGIWARRSRMGRLRWAANLRYCVADQSASGRDEAGVDAFADLLAVHADGGVCLKVFCIVGLWIRGLLKRYRKCMVRCWSVACESCGKGNRRLRFR